MKSKIYAARVIHNELSKLYYVEIKEHWYNLRWAHTQTFGYYGASAQKETCRKNAIECANGLVADTIEYTITN